MQEGSDMEQTISDSTLTVNPANRRLPEDNKKDMRKIILWIVIGVVAIIIVAIIVLAIRNNVRTSETSLTNRLEEYATKMYDENLKESNERKYITLNLNFFEKYGYDISTFESKKCDKTSTYAVVVLDDDKQNVEDIVTQLNCGEGE